MSALDRARDEAGRPATSSGEVVDLLAALQRSVDAAKARRSTTPAPTTPAPTPAHPSEEGDRG